MNKLHYKFYLNYEGCKLYIPLINNHNLQTVLSEL